MRWLIVDYGCVLSLDQTAEDRAALAEVAGMEQAEFDAGYWAHRDAYDLGAPSVAYWTRVLGRLPEGERVARLDALDAASWSHVNPRTERELQEVAGTGVRLALLSNAPEPVAHAIEELPAAKLFESLFFSCTLGLMKPARACYDAVTEALAVDPGELVFVDDRQVNVDAANAAGWDGVLFDHRTGLAPAVERAGR